MALQRSITLLPGVENHRAGRVLGDDGEARIVRTFHARFGSIKCGGTTTARQAAEYILREGKHAEDKDGMEDDAGDVEASAGDKEAMLADARRIRQTARITRGPTGERILATQIIELPAESTKEQRQACAQAFVGDWRERGHQAIAVVHMHGHDKDRPQPHLHVLATGRPVAADGTVDRSAPLWRNRDEVKAERARTARLVNEHCHTVAAFHPGGFKDIGREEDTPKWRTPTGVYLKVVAASAEGAGWEEKEEAGRAQYAAARKSAELAEPKRTRKEEIKAAEARGEKPPRVRPTQRQRIARAEADRSELAADLDRLAAERARQVRRTEAEEERARLIEQERDEAREQLRELNKTQTDWLTDWHGERGVKLPDLESVEGQSLAWANMRAWADRAEGRADELEARQVQPLALTERQRPMLVDVCARHGIEGDPANDARVQLLAWAAYHEERDKREEKRREAEAAAKKDEQGKTQEKIGEGVRLALEAERQEQNRDGRGTGEAGGDGRRPDQGADRPGTEARRGGGAEDHGAGRAERPRAGGDRPEGDDGREQTGGVGQPASAGGPHAVDGNVGGDRGAASPAAREPEGVESHVVAAPGREEADGLAREHGLVEEPGVVETPADRRGDGDGAMVGDDGGSDWNWLLGLDDAVHAPEHGRPVVAGPPPDVVVSGGGEEQQKAPEPPPPAPRAGPPAADLAAARAHAFTTHPYTARTADHGIGAPLEVDPAKLRGQHEDAALKKRLAARQQTEDTWPVFREDGKHAAIL